MRAAAEQRQRGFGAGAGASGTGEAAPQAAAGAGEPRTGYMCNLCQQPVTVIGGDPETAGTVLHRGERNEGDVGHVAAPIETALARRDMP
jgi:hypothetical protein